MSARARRDPGLLYSFWYTVLQYDLLQAFSLLHPFGHLVYYTSGKFAFTRCLAARPRPHAEDEVTPTTTSQVREGRCPTQCREAVATLEQQQRG